MKDAKGHGSDPRGAQTTVPPRPAHQNSIMRSLPMVIAKNAAKLYVAQAAAGAAVGFAYPIVKLFMGQ